jgi:hypothetical protein
LRTPRASSCCTESHAPSAPVRTRFAALGLTHSARASPATLESVRAPARHSLREVPPTQGIQHSNATAFTGKCTDRVLALSKQCGLRMRTRRNSCPTAPVTPTMATDGPSALLPCTASCVRRGEVRLRGPAPSCAPRHTAGPLHGQLCICMADCVHSSSASAHSFEFCKAAASYCRRPSELCVISFPCFSLLRSADGEFDALKNEEEGNSDSTECVFLPRSSRRWVQAQVHFSSDSYQADSIYISTCGPPP